MKTVSLVVPMYKEQDSAKPLFARVHEALADAEFAWELICVDDGSPDRTVAVIKEAIAEYGPHCRLVQLQRNFGQTAAMQAGIDAARGDLIVTMDGDLQNDPIDIPRMINEMEARDLDMIQGWREKRKDGMLLRKFPSKLANRLIAKVTGVKLRDYGCSLKVYKASIIKQVRLFGEMHRFIPVWVASVTSPNRIGETAVSHHARQFGESKYGLSRTFRVVLDLLSVFFYLNYRARPGHFFGYVGLVLGSLGSVVMAYLLTLKLGFGEDIGGRPLFFIGILLMIAAAQFITTGILAEMLSRVFFQDRDGQNYYLHENTDVADNADWQQPSKPQDK